MGGRGGFNVWGEAIEGGAIGVKLRGPFGCDLGQRTFFFAGAADGFVVDVGEVAHVTNLVGAEVEFEQAEVADVGGGVNRRAAVVETIDPVGVRRSEWLKGAGERIVELQGHGRVRRKYETDQRHEGKFSGYFYEIELRSNPRV